MGTRCPRRGLPDLRSSLPSPFLLAHSFVWASAGLPGRPAHAGELWRKFHSRPGAQRQLLASRLPNPRGASNSGLAASKSGLSHPPVAEPSQPFLCCPGKPLQTPSSVICDTVLKEFIEMSEVTAAHQGSRLGWEFRVSSDLCSTSSAVNGIQSLTHGSRELRLPLGLRLYLDPRP